MPQDDKIYSLLTLTLAAEQVMSSFKESAAQLPLMKPGLLFCFSQADNALGKFASCPKYSPMIILSDLLCRLLKERFTSASPTPQKEQQHKKQQQQQSHIQSIFFKAFLKIRTLFSFILVYNSVPVFKALVVDTCTRDRQICDYIFKFSPDAILKWY